MMNKLPAFLALLGFLCCGAIKGQTDISIGTGTDANINATYPCPLQDYAEGQRAQYLYKATELIAAGMQPGKITAIKWNITSPGTATVVENYAIRIGSSLTASLNPDVWETMPAAYLYGPANVTPVAGINTFTLATPFTWDGKSNLIVEVCNGATNSASAVTNSSNPFVTWTTGLSFNGSHTYQVNNAGSVCGTANVLSSGTTTTRPNIILSYTPEAACSGTPAGGVAISSVTTVCPDTDFTLSLTGSTTAAGLTYQWQSSVNNITWSDVFGAGATSPVYVTRLSSSLWYRCVVSCGSGTGSPSSSVQVTVPGLVSGNFTINKALATGSGNFQSFAEAYNYIKCGINGPVVFNVAAGGSYNEQLLINAIPGTSAANTVTFNGNGATIRFSSTSSNERAVIRLNNADHIRFNNLVIDAVPTASGTTYGYGIQLMNDADSNSIRNCTIKCNPLTTSNSGYAGVVINSSLSAPTFTASSLCDSNSVVNNTITGGYAAVTVVGNNTDANMRNLVQGNTLRDFYSYGVYVAGTYLTTVNGNDISRPTLATPGECYGIAVTTANTAVTVSGNKIHDPFSAAPNSTSTFWGIWHTNADGFGGGGENLVYNNLIYRINGAGAQYGVYNSGSDYVWYYHNTISLDHAASTSTNVTRAYYQNTQAAAIRFFNNIITITRGGTGAKHAIYRSTPASTDTMNLNDYYINAQNSAFGFSNNVSYYTMNTWQAGTLQDAGSFNYDPLYKDSANGDYSPNRLVLDARGAALGITTDIKGVARNTSTPDLGAFEFALPACNTTPVGGTALASPNAGVCMAGFIQLGLSGYTPGTGQNVQWQYAATGSGPWTNLGAAVSYPDTIIAASANLYYRATLTCGGNAATSTAVPVTVNAGLPAGVYTINPAAPVSAVNFQSFGAAVAAMECGIGGAVTFDVSPGTYNEQVRLHRIPGTGNSSRVTFRSLTGDPASVVITSGAATTLANYVLQLDSASYVTFKNLSITTTGTTFARAVDIANLSSYDSIINCTITVPATTTNVNTSAGVFTNTVTGPYNVISGNRITGGSNGIYFAGTTSAYGNNNSIEGNTITGAYGYGIYTAYNKRIRVAGNTVNSTTPIANFAYSIYGTYCDTAYDFSSNTVNVSKISGTHYGMYLYFCRNTTSTPGRVAGNKVQAVTGNTGTIYGLYEGFSAANTTVNNVINVKTTGNTSYGLYTSSSSDINVWNNTVNNASAAATATNAAAFLDHSSFTYGNVQVRNNIFSHTGGGRALNVSSYSFTNSDYNMLFTTGTNLVASTSPAAVYASLADWQNASGWDINSIVYQPAFTSDEELTPAVANPNVWAMQGRGVQLFANTNDINNNPRPNTFQAGVPDLGAYEFVPASVPVALTATPAAPAPGVTQTFTLGTDVAARITWGADAPAAFTLRRYSGVLSPALPASLQGMYYYLAADDALTGTYNAIVEQHYVPSWLGFINAYGYTKTGKTVAGGAWTVNAASTVDTLRYTVTEKAVNFLDKFTGLTDGKYAVTVPELNYTSFDSTNRGTEFWVPYGNTLSYKFTNAQELLLYFAAADKEAHVTVRVNGTTWEKKYTVAANSVVTSDNIPKAGINDARLLSEGLYSRGIHITSDVPVAAFAAQYIPTGESSNAASMLLPAGAYGYDYTSLNTTQSVFSSYDFNPGYSWVNVIATHDSTLVQITPANPTVGGRAAGIPFTVMMMKGQVYQVLGAVTSNDPAINSHDDSYDMSGTRVQSIANTSGNCYPVAVFSGSSLTYFGCGPIPPLTGDNYIQQCLPSQAWGNRYLTAPASVPGTPASAMMQIYRVAVKDVATVVKRNGVVLTDLVVPGNYYQFSSNTADYIETDKPVTVAQIMPSRLSCGNTDGDVEVIYLSAISQGITRAQAPRMMHTSTTSQTLTVIVPTAALGSLKIDNSGSFDYSYAHPNLTGYTVVVKHWATPVAGQAVITCDQPFTGISYGAGFQVNYGYNIGMHISNLGVTTSFVNTLNSTGTLTNEYTCAKAPFRPTIRIPLLAETITWKLSAVAGANPAADVTVNNPAPVTSAVVDGVTYYTYTLAQDISIAGAGNYVLPVEVKHSSFEGCNKTATFALPVLVKDAPKSDFTVLPAAACMNKPIAFSGTATATGFTLNRWNWTFSDGTAAAVQNTDKAFAAAGTQKATLRVISTEGCIGDTTKDLTIYALPVAVLVADQVAICPNETGSLSIAAPETGVVYRWYQEASGGSTLYTGTTFPVTATGTYYAEATSAQGCIGDPRTRAVVTIYAALPSPVVTVDSAGVNTLRFGWNEVPGAVSYSVSLDGGATFVEPSSGATGRTHTITPLAPVTRVTILVRANGAISCQTGLSAAVSGQTLPDQVFIPNSFTPNNDGRNDTWQVYGYTYKNQRVMVFNQWGEKVFEASGPQLSWDGTYKGKPQPSGVYLYVVQLTLNNGNTEYKKGSINLIR